MAVTRGNASTTNGSASSLTITSFAHNGDEIVVTVVWGSSSVTISSVAHGADNLAEVTGTNVTTAVGMKATIYTLTKATATADLVVTFSGSVQAVIGVESWSGCSSPSDGNTSAPGGNVTSLSLTAANYSAGDAAISACAHQNTISTVDSPATAHYIGIGLGGVSDGAAAYNTSSGAFTFNLSSGKGGVSVCRLPQAGAGGGPVTQLYHQRHHNRAA